MRAALVKLNCRKREGKRRLSPYLPLPSLLEIKKQHHGSRGQGSSPDLESSGFLAYATGANFFSGLQSPDPRTTTENKGL